VSPWIKFHCSFCWG